MKLKRRADGRLQKAFTFKGKRYCVYGRNMRELTAKLNEKKKEFEEGHEHLRDQTDTMELSPVERELVNSFRHIDDDGRDFIIYVLDHEKQRRA